MIRAAGLAWATGIAVLLALCLSADSAAAPMSWGAPLSRAPAAPAAAASGGRQFYVVGYVGGNAAGPISVNLVPGQVVWGDPNDFDPNSQAAWFPAGTWRAESIREYFNGDTTTNVFLVVDNNNFGPVWEIPPGWVEVGLGSTFSHHVADAHAVRWRVDNNSAAHSPK